MKLAKWPEPTLDSIIFTRPGAMSGIGYIREIHSWGYIKRYVNTQHVRNGYFECIDSDVMPRINDKTFYI